MRRAGFRFTALVAALGALVACGGNNRAQVSNAEEAAPEQCVGADACLAAADDLFRQYLRCLPPEPGVIRCYFGGAPPPCEGHPKQLLQRFLRVHARAHRYVAQERAALPAAEREAHERGERFWLERIREVTEKERAEEAARKANAEQARRQREIDKRDSEREGKAFEQELEQRVDDD
ncbi:MAG: hypothetical protein H6716_03365 [Polyangiaceae bacterium]|nr:hypothetical protein [Polyangiaceae bacterium]